MAIIPRSNSTVMLLDEVYSESKPRPYLGMSASGAACIRSSWYGFHWVMPNNIIWGRTQRIFDMGHSFEEICIRDLKSIGIEVFRVNPDGSESEMFGTKDEEQEEYIGFAGHVKGHNDGRCRNVPESPNKVHNLEIKTMNQANFDRCRAEGVKESHPGYWDQCQRYMHEQGTERTLFIAVNKNTSAYHIERIRYVKSLAKELIAKESHIVLSDEPPHRPFNKDSMPCKMCFKKKICWEGEEPARNCRTCTYCDIEMDGKWSCQKKTGLTNLLSVDEQRVGCNLHEYGWGLVK